MLSLLARAAKYDVATGEITGVREGEYLPTLSQGMAYHALGVDEACDPRLHLIVGGQVVLREIISPQVIAERREERKIEARAVRDMMIFRGCMTPLGRVQTDEASQTNIMGAMMLAQAALANGVPFEQTWRMEDNSLVAHNAQQMIAMAISVGIYKSACFSASFVIIDAIEASGDPTSVQIMAGYP